MIIVLDTFPASSMAKSPRRVPSLLDRCRDWVSRCERQGHTVLVPAIVYYEALRELELRRAAQQIQRLRTYCLHPDRYIPLTTVHLDLAARLWAQSRRVGTPTASAQALDADVILAAQALGLGLGESDYIVATTNPAHLSRFVHCAEWTEIVP
jgi:predicted nucleic acid-binding protein